MSKYDDLLVEVEDDNKDKPKITNEMDEVSAARSLAVVYFLNILAALFFPIVLLTELLRVRFVKKLESSTLRNSEFVKAHVKWQKNMNWVVMYFMIGSLAYAIYGHVVESMGGKTASSDPQMLLVIAMLVAICFMAMLMWGYIALLIKKTPGFKRKQTIEL